MYTEMAPANGSRHRAQRNMNSNWPAIRWPDGKSFAFSIFDDTDLATISNVSEVYRFLEDLGIHSTKSVWPSRGYNEPIIAGATCEDAEYCDWLLSLQAKGFEIAYHMNTYHDSQREEVRRGLQRFRDTFGHPPRTMANHTTCRENIYWGPHRVTGKYRLIYNVLTGFRHTGSFHGHLEGDPYFWGDLCRDSISYCRNFVYADINTLKACPYMPYRDPRRPFVRSWFASSEGPRLDSFNRLLSESNQDRLEREGGVSIVYTHFACSFQKDGKLNARFRELLERLCSKNGWFVPVATLLDYIVKQRGIHEITPRERAKLERRWLFDKLFVGSS